LVHCLPRQGRFRVNTGFVGSLPPQTGRFRVNTVFVGSLPPQTGKIKGKYRFCWFIASSDREDLG